MAGEHREIAVEPIGAETRGAHEKDGRRFLYYPVLARTDYLHSESKSLVDRLFGGRITPFVAHFSEKNKLSKRDLAELRKLLRELDDD